MIYYLATPYSHPDESVMHARFEAVCEFCARALRSGRIVYSPIVHNHPIATRHVFPRTWDFWKKFDLPILERCDVLWVLTLDGYLESVGVNAEIAHARGCGIPVLYYNIDATFP